MTGLSNAAILRSIHWPKSEPLEYGEPCATKGCPRHGGPRFTALDGQRYCLACYDRVRLHVYAPADQPKPRDIERYAGKGGNPTGRRKLTDEQVLEIRRRYAGGTGDTQTALAREFEVNRKTILECVRGITHRHLPRDGVL